MYLRRNSIIFRFYLFSILVFYLSCKEESSDNLDWQYYEVEDYTIHSIGSYQDRIIAFGGHTWTKGVQVHITQGDVRVDSISPTIILDSYIQEDNILACGPYYILQSDQQFQWDAIRLVDFDIARSCLWSENQIISVGGLGFDFGTRYLIDAQNDNISRSTIDHTLEKLVYYKDKVIALGFGIIYTSSDTGLNWSTTPLKDGHFVDACVFDDRLYVLNSGGEILIANGTLTAWDEKIGLPTDDITAFLVLSQDEIIISNRKGVLYRYTKSNGIEVLARFDRAIHSLYYTDMKVYVGGEDGLLASTNF